MLFCFFFFFFQAEDGIRDKLVTGVQTCALPIFGGGVVVYGVWQALMAGGNPMPVVPPPAAPAEIGAAVSVWLLLRAFASGCTAMTGVEAVSNGVSAFRDPAVRYARRTLTAIVLILGFLLTVIS